MDLHDIATFYEFFKDLYREQTLPPETVERLKTKTDDMQRGYIENEIDEILNNTISLEELSRCIKKLKKGKAGSEDGILNEFLINSTSETRLLILKVFNECLSHGIYPWNTTSSRPCTRRAIRVTPIITGR